MKNSFTEFTDTYSKNIIENTTNYIETVTNNSLLKESMIYSLTAGGKRIRPMLFLAMIKTFSNLEISDYCKIAGSIEMIHTYSLIHDDLPEMDNDDLRRGKLTNHKKFGVGPAVLAGDGLLTMSFNLISTSEKITDDKKIELISILSEYSGTSGMISGQMTDITNENKKLNLEELVSLHMRKTGDLLIASILMGLVISDSNDEIKAKMKKFGKNIGLAFQVKDDILDQVSNEEIMGKKTHKDLKKGKNTFPSLIGLDASKKYLNDLILEAKQILNSIDIDTKLIESFLEYFNLGE